MRKRRQVARCPERSPLGDHRQNVVFEEFEEALRDHGAHPRVPERQDVRSQQHHGTHLPLAERRAHRHRV